MQNIICPSKKPLEIGSMREQRHLPEDLFMPHTQDVSVAHLNGLFELLFERPLLLLLRLLQLSVAGHIARLNHKLK